MCSLVRGLRLPWVALVAIAGTLWNAPAVTACTAEKAPKCVCCCASRMSTHHRCCSEVEDRLETTLPFSERAGRTTFSGTRAPCDSCVCNQPTSPARHSESNESQTHEDSNSEAVRGSLDISHSDCASLAPRPLTQTGLVPIHTPLYLRVERLMI